MFVQKNLTSKQIQFLSKVCCVGGEGDFIDSFHIFIIKTFWNLEIQVKVVGRLGKVSNSCWSYETNISDENEKEFLEIQNGDPSSR